MNSAVIRLLTQSDIDDIAENCFPELSRDEVIERVTEDIALQQKEEGFTLVAEVEKGIFATAKLLKRGEVGWVFNVVTHPSLRGKGIMQQLFSALAATAQEMGLKRLAIHVRADNTAARRAYEKAGFRYAGVDGMRGDQLHYEKPL